MSTATTTEATGAMSRAAASVWMIRCSCGTGCASWGWAGVSATTRKIPTSTPRRPCAAGHANSGCRRTRWAASTSCSRMPGQRLNDGTDRAHKGFVCFNGLLDEYQPAWFVHGHVHLNYDAKLPRVCTRGNNYGDQCHGALCVLRSRDPDPLQKRKFLWGQRKEITGHQGKKTKTLPQESAEAFFACFVCAPSCGARHPERRKITGPVCRRPC